MRKRYRYDRETKQVIPLEDWLAKYGQSRPKAHHVIGDIEPYKAVTGDMEGRWITSRSQHRAFLQRNNLIEVGNEKSYMTRNGGMTSDNPNLLPERVHEERIACSLKKNLEILRNR